MAAKAHAVVPRMLPEVAHGLTLDEWCRAFERPFIGTAVRITERKCDIITRDRRVARRKELPESEECCSYSMHKVPPPSDADGWKGTFLGIEVSAYWEEGVDPERFAHFVLSRHFSIRVPEEATP